MHKFFNLHSLLISYSLNSSTAMTAWMILILTMELGFILPRITSTSKHQNVLGAGKHPSPLDRKIASTLAACQIVGDFINPGNSWPN